MKKIKSISNNFLILLMLIVLLATFSTGILAQSNNEQKSVTPTNIFSDIASNVDSGVVKVTSKIEVNNGNIPYYYSEDFYEYFFGETLPKDKSRVTEGYGSGFIVSEDGYIITNEHVVHNAIEINVNIQGFNKTVPAEVKWTDYNLDLAILKVNVNKTLSPIPLGNSDKLKPGNWTIAIGNPFGLNHTVTTGVVSALERPLQIPTNGGTTRTYNNLIQTDAAINPGNSGGPLLNIEGEVIGINTAVSSSGQGIGFAIPINEVKGYINDLKTKGEIKRPWLGIIYGPITSEAKEYFNLDNTNGVIIHQIIKDSPAEKAKLKQYDIIKEIDKKPIKKIDNVAEIINNNQIGDKIMINIIRDGDSKIFFAEIEKRPSNLAENF